MENPVKSQECCMCGDHGFSDQLFRCKFCHFRSQHRYCSNLYPKAEPDGVCNWCLSKRKTDKTLVRPSTTSLEFPCKKRSVEDEGELYQFKKISLEVVAESKGVKKNRAACRVVKPMSRVPQRLPEKAMTRRRIITKGELEEKMKLRMSKSQEMMKVRSKVIRRYKLLDEVAT